MSWQWVVSGKKSFSDALPSIVGSNVKNCIYTFLLFMLQFSFIFCLIDILHINFLASRLCVGKKGLKVVVDRSVVPLCHGNRLK